MPDDKALFAISVAPELSQCHPRTLRLYEEYGFLTPVRTAGNTRLYSARDIAVIRKIRYYTRVKGVNLAGVRIILEMEMRLGLSKDDPED
ncbi:MAG TPA: MerR family transcriptional regulator [Spirochaetia bacterium]|nr:MerR family transcriptional regulator [Spirochaetia bacterium]